MEQLLGGITALHMNVAFGGVILTMWAVGLSLGAWGPASPRSRRRAYVVAAPGLMVGTGVFGTFLGIFAALRGFDVADIDSSVPTLLEGMKTAFFSSVCGMFASLTFRLCSFGFKREEVVATDPMAMLGAIREGIEHQTAAIAGDGEESLASQVRRMRTDGADASRDLAALIDRRAGEQIAEFRDFAKHMVDNTHGALIEALEGVIRDFNDKLTEQFGENFKQLNAAVGRLVEWQERYRDQMDRMEARLDAALSATEAAQGALTVSSAAMTTMAGQADAITRTAERLGAAVEDAKTSIGAMADLTGTLAELRGKALEAFPVIEKNLADVTGGMRTAAEAQRRHLTDASDTLGASLKDTTERSSKAMQDAATGYGETMAMAVKDTAENLKTSIENQTDTLTASLERAEKALADAIRADSEALRDALLEAAKRVDDGVGALTQGIDDRFEQFDQQSQQAVSRVIEDMGGKLASISGKLTEDYGIIIDAVDGLKRRGGRAYQ